MSGAIKADNVALLGVSVDFRYNPPPNWPALPDGWCTPAGWKTPDDWPPLPPGWQLWLPQPEPAPSAAQPRTDGTGTGVRVGLFGARKKLRQVEAAHVDAVAQNAALGNEICGAADAGRRASR